MVRRCAIAVPGDLATPTGGYAYDRRIIAELRRLGWRVDLIDIGSGFPFPDDAQRAAAARRLSSILPGCPLVIDGLAFAVLADEAKCLRSRHPLVALVHHPLALESGIEPSVARDLYVSEREALENAACVIATSAPTADILAFDYGVPRARMAIAPPGCDPAPLACGSRDGVVRLLAVGAVTPRKGHDRLVEALASLRGGPWRLTIAGALDRDVGESRRLGARIEAYGLGEQATLAGAISQTRLGELYQSADVFVSASRFEGYGMALAEAIAHGIPVVSTRVGAAADVVSADAGLLLEAGDADGLARALESVIAQPQLRDRLRRGAQAARTRLPRWSDAAERIARALETLA